MAPLPLCDSAVVPYFHGSQSSPVGIPCCGFSPSHLPTANSSSRSRPVLQSPRSSSQPPCTPVNTCPSPGHIGLWYRPSVYFSLYPACHRSATSPSFDNFKCFPSVPIDFPVGEGVSPNLGISPLLQLPCSGLRVLSCFLSSSFSLLFCPTHLCRDIYSLFWCPVSSASVQQVFCENCCIYRCIPVASMERDDLHILLLLRHLNSPNFPFNEARGFPLVPHHPTKWANIVSALQGHR